MSAINQENILGTKGNTMVYEGVWDEKPVAIKRMDLINTRYNRPKVEALKKLNHPNIVKLFHTQSDENFRIYYLELCSASLDKVYLKDDNPEKYNGPLPPTKNVLSQLAMGLEYIHKKGLIHRNIKPENVLIWVNPENGNVLMKWADFGSSKSVNERGSYSMSGVRGTHQWLAPELLKLLDDDNMEDFQGEREAQQRGTIQTDVFAEGLVFGYYLTGGKHLFGPRFQIPENILANNPVNLSEIHPQYARDLIQKMLADQPEDRITSSEVAQHLVKHAEDVQSPLTEQQPTTSQVKLVLEIKVNLGVKLGKGGYGVVFEGEWKNDKVAVKRIEKLPSAKGDEQEEEKALKKLEHPNVIKLLHVESDATFRYYALELCEASLDNLFLNDGEQKKYNGPMPPPIEVLSQLAEGLEHIHEKGLIHRDIKPQNVLIWVSPENGQVLMKWADFGLSRQVNERGSYSMSTVKGTFDWLAPEILELLNEDISQSGSEIILARQRGNVKSDVYAEGLVFGHFLLNGRHIFGKRIEIPPNILKNNQVNINDIQPEFIRKLIVNMIEKIPGNRISSREVAEQLDNHNSRQTNNVHQLIPGSTKQRRKW